MLITSNPVVGSAHVLRDATHAQTEQAHPEATVSHQSPSTAANPLASLTATNGLHPVVKGSVDTNAQRAGKPNPGKMNFEHYFDKASAGGLHPIAGGQVATTAKGMDYRGLSTPADAVINATGNGHEGGTSDGGGVFGPLRALRDKMLGGGGGPKPA